MGGPWRGIDLTDLATNSFIDRFWVKVDASGECWEWRAHRKPGGYGQFTVRKGYFASAHVVSYALTNGPIPAGMVVCHRCDNPPCVRPDHLFLGTQADNARDMIAKGRDGRRLRGEEKPGAKLTEDAVRAIRAEPRCQGYIKRLAAKYGVSTRTIYTIRAGSKWRDVS
jgi:hypothetical protein